MPCLQVRAVEQTINTPDFPTVKAWEEQNPKEKSYVYITFGWEKRGQHRETAASLYLLFSSLWKSCTGKFYSYCCVNSKKNPTSYSWNKSPQLVFQIKAEHMPLTSLFTFLMCPEITPTLEENSIFTDLPSPLGKWEKATKTLPEKAQKHTRSKIFILLPIPGNQQSTYSIALWNKQRHWRWCRNNLKYRRKFHPLQKKKKKTASISI